MLFSQFTHVLLILRERSVCSSTILTLPILAGRHRGSGSVIHSSACRNCRGRRPKARSWAASLMSIGGGWARRRGGKGGTHPVKPGEGGKKGMSCRTSRGEVGGGA